MTIMNNVHRRLTAKMATYNRHTKSTCSDSFSMSGIRYNETLKQIIPEIKTIGGA